MSILTSPSGRVWQSGMRCGVCFAAWIPAIRALILPNQIQRRALEPNPAGGDSFSLTNRLGRNVDHLGAAIVTDVSESLHFCMLVILSGAKNL